MLDVITITVPNWERFNPRSDRANHSWFRLQNGFLQDPKVFALADAEVLLLLMIYSECGKAGQGLFQFSIPLAAALRRTTVEVIRSQIQHIADLGFIRCQDDGHQPPLGNHLVSLLPTTNERTNVTNVTNVTNETDITDSPASAVTEATPDLDFEGLYQVYPRKVGRTDALDRMRKLVKTPDEYSKLCHALARFKKHHADKGTQEQYLPHMTTFLGVKGKERWRDWLDPETGTADVTTPTSGPPNRAQIRENGNRSALAEYLKEVREASGGGDGSAN